MEVVNHAGFTDDQDVIFTEIVEGGDTSNSIWNQTQYPLLQRPVVLHSITYNVYYIKFREGVGDEPCNIDGVYASYKGTLLNGTVFDQTTNPQSLFSLEGVIRGWSEIFPQFASGTYSSNTDGTVSYNDFGAGLMFLPSGLGYFNTAQTTIPAYSPLIFNIKLFEIKRLDQDGDGIPSYLEDLNGDRYIYLLDEGVVNPDDTDGDNFPDYLDLDDDGDLILTRTEIRYVHPDDPDAIVRTYPYNGAAFDDPSTLYVDERQGIPRAFTGPINSATNLRTPLPEDFTDSLRLRRHLDPTCKPPYQ
jgi:hypothetical protein